MHVISWYILRAMRVHCVYFALSSLYQLCECLVCPISVSIILLDHNISKLRWYSVDRMCFSATPDLISYAGWPGDRTTI